jgi:sentrin-specific protease 1
MDFQTQPRVNKDARSKLTAPLQNGNSLNHHYTFNTLPDFASSKRSSNTNTTASTSSNQLSRDISGYRPSSIGSGNSSGNYSNSTATSATDRKQEFLQGSFSPQRQQQQQQQQQQLHNERVQLPFVPAENYPLNKSFFTESRLPRAPSELNNAPNMNPPHSGEAPLKTSRLFSGQFKFGSNSLFGSRVWSSGSDRSRLFSNRHYTLPNPNQDVEDKNGINGGNTNPTKNTVQEHYTRFGKHYGDIHRNFSRSGELYDFVTTFFMLLYALTKKFGAWIVWVLNFVFAFLLNKIRTIPDPNWEKQMPPVTEDDAFIESTPMKKRTIDFEEGKSAKNPLFQEKLKSIRSKVNAELQKVNDSHQDESNMEVDNTVAIFNRKNKPKYGTAFFNRGNTTTTDSNGNINTNGNYIANENQNLEKYFFQTAMNIDKDPKDVVKRSTEIRENMLAMYKDSSNNSSGTNSIPTKPSFTRSTRRFQDLEWLKDDSEDYLNNLESTKLFKEYQKIITERKKMQQLLHLSKLKEQGLGVRALTRDQTDEVESVWENQPNGKLINKYRIDITSRDLFTLSDRHWLNDNVIDFYLQLVKDDVNAMGHSKVHVFSTYFYTTLSQQGYQGVRKWAKRAKINVAEMDYIFVPVNLNQAHWALAVIDNIEGKFMYVDSLFGDGTTILARLVDYMERETSANLSPTADPRNFEGYTIEPRVECPNQQNGYDCGVFTCTAVDYMARGKSLDYSQADMPILRRRMAWEILKGKLITH